MIYVENNGIVSKLSVTEPFTPTHTPVKLWELTSFSVDGLESLLNGVAYQLLIPTLPEWGGIVKAAVIWEEIAVNSNPGTFTSGAWRQRTLNTELDPDSLCTLASNTVTVAVAGNYLVRASAPAYSVLQHQCRLLKNGSQVAIGSHEYATASNSQSRSFVVYVGTLAANDTITLEHRCNTTVSSNGFGVGGNWIASVFAILELIKLD